MSEEKNKTLSFVERMKLRAQTEAAKNETVKEFGAAIGVEVCPNCGAGRAKQDGLTKCAYCGFVFIETTLTDGLNVTKEDNSR